MNAFLTKIVAWLQAGYPDGIPATDRVPLLALLSRRRRFDKHALVLAFEGMDAAGKDSAIKSVFEGVNPQGCEVTAFKQPSTKELDHDFMWRSMIALTACTVPSKPCTTGAH